MQNSFIPVYRSRSYNIDIFFIVSVEIACASRNRFSQTH